MVFFAGDYSLGVDFVSNNATRFRFVEQFGNCGLVFCWSQFSAYSALGQPVNVPQSGDPDQ